MQRPPGGGLASYCLPPWAWANNGGGQNPCEVARELAGQCGDAEPYFLYPLNSSSIDKYPPPTRQQASACMCSMPVYNLVAVCSACQETSISRSAPWALFVSQCDWTSVPFPSAVPLHTDIPHWATMNNTDGAIDIFLAFHEATGVRATIPANASSSISPSISSVAAPPTLVPVLTSTESPAISSPTSTIIGDNHHVHLRIGRDIAIALSIIAICALAIAGVLAAWLWRKRRVRRQGTRLGSKTDLLDATRDEGVMAEKHPTMPASFDDVFVRTETLVSSRSSHASSYITNSSSSQPQSHDYRSYLRNAAAYSPSFDSFSTHSSQDSSSDATDASLNLEAAPIMSPSPFSDGHRISYSSTDSRSSAGAGAQVPTLPALAALRHGLHDRVRDSISSSASHPRSSHSFGPTDTLSLVSSRAAPSSTGAVYGRDDEDGLSIAGSEGR